MAKLPSAASVLQASRSRGQRALRWTSSAAASGSMVAASGHGQAVVPRLRAARSIVVINLEWGALGSEQVLAMAAPLWSVLAQLSPGLSMWDGNGIFDGQQQLVDLSAVR